MSGRNQVKPSLSRRGLLKSIGLAPLLLRPAPFRGASLLFGLGGLPGPADSDFAFGDIRFKPHYPTPSPLADILRLVPPGLDNYPSEKYASEIESQLKDWSVALQKSPRDLAPLAKSLHPSIQASSLVSPDEQPIRSGYGIEIRRRRFDAAVFPGRERFLAAIHAWLGPISTVETAEFEIYGIEETGSSPLAAHLDIRYDIVAAYQDGRREERVGSWSIDWSRQQSGTWLATRWLAGEETLSVAHQTIFLDVTAQAIGNVDSYKSQLQQGVDYWRTVLDNACAIDLYNNTGVAAGDFDNDGFDDFYVCQPAGLPNRLYRNRGDGTFEDVTERAGVGVLDNTACALFADFENKGLQDLLVVCGTGPLLFLNQGNGAFLLKRDAFTFARPPQGSFTHAALADYDRDGRLDICFCTYMYYLGLDQYHYPVPYFDARNGPPNCLMHNEGNATFVETTEATGLNVDNDRYSFACAWGDSTNNGLPDLFIVNDFGSSQLYRNNGDGTFKVASGEAHVEEVGAGMSCAWSDYDNDGHQDVYVPSMWEAAGQRVSAQKQFHADASGKIRALYRRHARGNALYRNMGNGTFQNVGHQAGVEMGRWSWCSDFLDFDHDGFPDLYVANGYISGPNRDDLASFFWRQVVAKSPEDSTPSLAYERGWNAINELIRSDDTWHGYARNVMFANNRDGTFSEISGPAGLDFIDDSRSFALADIDHDGRLEIILKNRNAPQLRILHNVMQDIGDSISFRLRGHKSNRDAIGASVTVQTGSLRQTKYLQAGSGFLAQHSKELFFGLGKPPGVISAIVRWPGGLTQKFDRLPANHRIEIEEGSSAFDARPFSTPPPSWAHAEPTHLPEPLPAQVETWLLQPLKAPEFSLPDLTGRMQDLASLLGSFVLLSFWETEGPLCRAQLSLFEKHHVEFTAAGLRILAVNLDDASSASSVRSLAREEQLSFPILLATPEVAGIYNIVYRYLFDRRRDLAVPTSLLLDREGMIVKVYQGPIIPRRTLEDVKSIGPVAADRLRRALPFPGRLYQGAFQRNDFTYGVALFQHGYLDQAEESFQQVIAVKPADPDAYYNLGTLNLRRNNVQQARDYLEQCLKLRPDYPEAWNNLGMIAAQQGATDEAIRDFQHSLAQRPAYSTALLNLGNVYRRQRDFEKAELCLSQALALQADDPEINYSYGMLFAQQGQLQKAMEYLDKAIDLRPDYPEALNNLGVLYVRIKNYPQAEAQFKTCIRLAPGFDRSYLNLANLYAMRDNSSLARDVLEELLRVQPGNPAANQALQALQSPR